MSVLALAENRHRMSFAVVSERLHVALETVRLWSTRGCRVGDKIVKLQSFRLSNRLFTTEAHLESFLSAING